MLADGFESEEQSIGVLVVGVLLEPAVEYEEPINSELDIEEVVCEDQL